MKKIKTVFSLCMLMTGIAHATVINITGANGGFGTTDVGTMETITVPADQEVLTSLSWTVSGLTIDDDGVANDTAKFTLAISPVGAGPINWDVNTVSEFDYNGATFGGTSEGITFGAITVSGTSSGGLGYQLESALYKEWTVRRWGSTDTMTVVGDVTGTQNLAAASDPSNTTLDDSTFTATAGTGSWNGLNIDFTVDVSTGSLPVSSTLSGGIIVAVDFASGTAVETLVVDAGLSASDNFVVHGLFDSESAVATATQEIVTAGSHGKVSCELYDGVALPYIDGLVNRVYCTASSTVPMAEFMRVLAPGGSLMVADGSGGWTETVKPILNLRNDEWNQFLHGADNNGVSHDEVSIPQRLRWHTGPEHGRHKRNAPSFNNMVTADGLMFTIEDRASPQEVTTPQENYLVARDAYNGLELWKMSLPVAWNGWQVKASIKSTPTQMQRLLAAIGDKLYFCAGFGSSVTEYDARTGVELQVYDTAGHLTAGTSEFIIENNILYGIKGNDPYKLAGWDTATSTVDVYALDLSAGTILWSNTISNEYLGGTVAVKGANLVYMNHDGLTCLNSATGSLTWTSQVTMPDPEARAPTYYELFTNNIQPTLVLTDDMIYCNVDGNLGKSNNKGDRSNDENRPAQLTAIHLSGVNAGTTAWTADTWDNYMKSPDLFIAAGLVWSGDYNGRDPLTGTIVQTLAPTMVGPMSHLRCTRNRITETYYLNSETGGTDLLSLDGTFENANPWLRSTCGLAMMPANGMLYGGPYVCQCTINAMLTGVNAVYNGGGATWDGLFSVAITPQLVQGPAYGNASGVDATLSDWPTYRYSGTRSSVSAAPAAAAATVTTLWDVDIGSNPTAPVVADDTVYVADKDTYILHALDRENGATRWTFAAGGSMDSPPTYYKGMVLFGTRTGWVYCLRASDGELVWKFNGMPTERLMSSYGRLESAWPVSGCVMVFEDTVYFGAGRSSFLDGGIGVFALDPTTGELEHSRMVKGPYETDYPDDFLDENGVSTARSTFPIELGTFLMRGLKEDIMSNNGGEIFMRNQAFSQTLELIEPDDVTNPHIMCSTGMLDDSPTHRTYWTVDRDLAYPSTTSSYFGTGPEGDITAFDGEDFYEVRGYSNGRNLVDEDKAWEPYELHAVYSGSLTDLNTGSGNPSAIPGIGTWAEKWETRVPLSGSAIAASRNTVLVAGVPLLEGDTEAQTVESYAGLRGGSAWLLSESTGSLLKEFTFDSPPVWDGIAIAHESYFITLQDGSVICLAGEAELTPFLAGSWNFNEGTGTVATDTSWDGHHGTITDGTWVTGASGGAADKALSFNGTTSSVSIPPAVFANASNQITIAMKVYGDDANAHSSDYVFGAVDSGGARVLALQLPFLQSAVTYAMSDMGEGTANGAGYDRLKVDGLTSDQFEGQWNHWVFTKDTVAGTMAMYLNGELFGSITGKTKPFANMVSPAIGSYNSSSYYDGTIDDVQIYNASLTATEVYDLYHLDAITSTYSSWFTSQGLIGADAEPDADTGDGDGLANLLEFAFGTDPDVSDSAAMAINGGSFTPGTPGVEIELGPFDVKARFIRRSDHATSGITYTLQFTHALTGTWEDVDGSTAVRIPGTSESNGYEAVELSYPLFLNSGRKARFYRVQVNEVD